MAFRLNPRTGTRTRFSRAEVRVLLRDTVVFGLVAGVSLGVCVTLLVLHPWT